MIRIIYYFKALTTIKKNDKIHFVILAGELAVPCIYNPL